MTGTPKLLPLARIRPDLDNVRHTPATAAEDAALLASIKAFGVLQAILVRPAAKGTKHADWIIVAGQRRWAQAQAAGLTEIPALIKDAAEIGTSSDVPAMQLAENFVRAEMSPIDVWTAVERMHGEGMAEPAIAVAFNLTERRVRQLIAMGSLHPKLVEYARRTGELPSEEELREIAQAPHSLQVTAFEAATKNRFFRWAEVARHCDLRRIPMSYARFDRALYTGPIFRDLFSDEQEEEAEDTEQFLRLQHAWLDEQLRIWEGKGFADARELPADIYSRGAIPANWDQWSSQPVTKRIAKGEKQNWAYGIRLDTTGKITEALYRVRDRKAAAVQAGEKAAPAERSPVTKAGIALIAKAQDTALQQAVIQEAQTPELSVQEALTLVLVALGADNLRVERPSYTRANLSAISSQLVDKEGCIRDLEDQNLVKLAMQALSAILVVAEPGYNSRNSGKVAQWIGRDLHADFHLPSFSTPEFLKTCSLKLLQSLATPAGLAAVIRTAKDGRTRLQGKPNLIPDVARFGAPGPSAEDLEHAAAELDGADDAEDMEEAA